MTEAEKEILDVEQGGKQLSLPGTTRQELGLLTEDETAAALGVTAITLARWRNKEGKGPAFVRPGKSVFYRRVDVDAWLMNIVEWPVAQTVPAPLAEVA